VENDKGKAPAQWHLDRKAYMQNMEKRSFTSLLYNRISFAGGILAGIVLVAIILMLFVTWLGGGSSPYFGLVAFLVLPPFLILFILLIPLGVYLERRRWIRSGRRTEALFPVIDLNIYKHRLGLSAFITGVFTLVIVTAVGSYNAYHFTETTKFCGTLCHEVMHPEYAAYTRSPHARVRCVDCHVGSGANFYVKSKLSGLYQVYAAIANVYPKPIPVPIRNLRPAQETCEQCHWPDAFFGAKQRVVNHFLNDKNNTPWDINLLIRIGGGSPGTAQTTGIHWHMNIANMVEFIARDMTQQDIPWVKITNLKTGVTNVYNDIDNPLTPAEIDSLPKYRMDCMNCHNRPTHIFRSPNYSMNLALSTGRIDPKLPFIKKNGVAVLTGDYKSTEEALDKIAKNIWTLYEPGNFPDTSISNASIEQSIQTLKETYTANFFPEMGVRWDLYLDNIGHLNSKGCYRCHAGNHQTEDGKTITRECNACHTIIAQGKPGEMEIAVNPDGLRFKHPVDIDDAWTEMGCYECHTGTSP